MTARASSLRWRVLLVLALAAVVPVVIAGALAIARARGDAAREAEHGALAHVQALGAALDGALEDARRTVELAAAIWADAPDDPRTAQRLIERVRHDVPMISGLSIVDANGELRAGDPVPSEVDVGAISGSSLGDVHRAGGRTVVYLVIPARGRGGERSGAWVARLDLGFVRDAIAAARLGPGARVVVVDGAGVPIASSQDLRGVPSEPWASAPASLAGIDPAVDRALASSAEGTISARGWLTAYRRLASGARWAILHQQPEREVYALARGTTRDTAIVLGAALALALALGAWFATRLTRPLAALARRADAIAEGMPVTAAALEGPGEIGVLGERIDGMARRIAERSELQAALARGDRMASVGVLSAQVAHELDRPLTAVLGHTRQLQEDKPEGHPDRAALERIASEAQRMKDLTSALLGYACAPRPPERTASERDGVPRCEPAAVVRHASAMVGAQLARAGATLSIDLAATAPVAIDAHVLQQVLVHLVQHALGAMHEAGVGSAIAIASRPAPGGVATLITVADDGPGIPAADRARVFDPFFSTRGRAGLDLAVCKHLIATAGGSIEVGAAPGGRGTELRILLPRSN